MEVMKWWLCVLCVVWLSIAGSREAEAEPFVATPSWQQTAALPGWVTPATTDVFRASGWLLPRGFSDRVERVYEPFGVPLFFGAGAGWQTLFTVLTIAAVVIPVATALLLIANIVMFGTNEWGVRLGFGWAGLAGGVLSSAIGVMLMISPYLFVFGIPVLVVGLAAIVLGVINIASHTGQTAAKRKRRLHRHLFSRMGSPIMSDDSHRFSAVSQRFFFLQFGF
jgi:hypothetical protein